MAVAPLFWFYLVALVVGLPPLLLLAQHAFPGAWRPLPPWRAPAWALLSGIVLSLGSLAIVEAPARVTVVPAGLVGLFDALAWYAIADAVALARAARKTHRPVVALRPAAIAVATAVVAAGAGFGIAIWFAQPSLASSRAPGGGRPLLDLHGFRSSFDGRSRSSFSRGFVYRRYSYRGLGPDGKPLPYGPRGTYQRLSVSARKLGLQVEALRSLVDCAPLLRHGLMRALPHVRQFAFLPLVNAIAEPPRIASQIPVSVLPTIHAAIGSSFHAAVALRLSGRRPPRFPAWEVAERIIRGTAAAWQVPSLPLDFPQAWRNRPRC